MLLTLDIAGLLFSLKERNFNQTSFELTKIIQESIRRFFEKSEKELKDFQEKEDIRHALRAIESVFFICSKYNCISCAKTLVRYLTHKSDLVRQFAASALVFVFEVCKQAAFYFRNDPGKLSELKIGLSEIISEIKNLSFNSIPLNLTGFLLERAIIIAESALNIASIKKCTRKNSNENLIDEFVKNEIQDSINRLVRKDTIESSIKMKLSSSP